MKKCNCESTCEDCRMERENNEDMASIVVTFAVGLCVIAILIFAFVKILLAIMSFII